MKKRLAIVVIFILIPLVLLQADDAEYLSYHKLILEIETGSVQSVTISGCRSIRGVYLEDDIEKEFSSWHEDEAASDPLFISLLKDNNVEIVVEEDAEPKPWFYSFLFGIFVFVIPMISLVLVTIILLKVNRLTPKAEIRAKP